VNGWNVRHQRLTLDLPGSVGLVIVVATLALLAGCQASSGVTVDQGRRRIVIHESVPGSFDVCDGPTGACFALDNLRAATAAIRGVK